MPTDPGNLSYAEAVQAGLYPADDSHADADGAMVTYGVGGPPIQPHFGNSGTRGPVIRQAERS